MVSSDAPLERSGVLRVLVSALEHALAGRGSMVVVSGEAGIGKTELVLAFLAAAAERARVLRGACDDLVIPRPLGPLREAVAGTLGPLESAIAAGDNTVVPDAALCELSRTEATVLVIEDVQWADDATLDVLGFLARRLAGLPATVVVTLRDNTPAPAVLRWLGALSGFGVPRIRLEPLSVQAVGTLATGSAWDGAELHNVTGGNPFYVTEVLAASPTGPVPTAVADAVLAGLGALSDPSRRAVEQLAVVPGIVDFALVEQLVGDEVDALAEAEEHGVLEVRADGLAFRHELVRRAVEERLPGLRRRQLHRLAFDALDADDRRPELSRLVHHAVAAGSVDAVARYAVDAGREAAAGGTHQVALAHFRVAAQHEHLLDLPARARLAEELAREFHNAALLVDAVAAAERAVELHARVGDDAARGQALARLSDVLFTAGDTERAEAAAQQAVDVLEADSDTVATVAAAYAATQQGALQVAAGHPDATATLRHAEHVACRAGRIDLVTLGRTYQSLARPDLTDADRIRALGESIEPAQHEGRFEHAARAYTCLAELLYALNRLTELERCLAEGLAATRERGLHLHTRTLEAYGVLLRMRRGEWDGARTRLAAFEDVDPGRLSSLTEIAHLRLLVRAGDESAGHGLRIAWQRAQRQRSLASLAHCATALAEWAWLTGHPQIAAEARQAFRPYAERPGAAHAWAEILRFGKRAGLPAEPFPGCPHPWDAGLRGDWRTATAGWEEIGDPYHRALEAAESGQVEPTVDALRRLDGLGATAVSRLVRIRLRELGLRTVPRGPHATTRAHPAGLTARQSDVLELLAEGLTNSEIAARLVLSVRTVDHHVSAILTKLGVASRRQAAASVRGAIAS